MNQQIPRLLAVFAVAGVGLVSARHYMVPPSFGKLGHYRADAVTAIAARPQKLAGQVICAECHDDIVATRKDGNHRTLSCEVCHGPAAIHADSLEPKPAIPQPRKFCPVCHAYDPSRPTGFPQIDPVAHNPLIACTKCHNPHAPVPPEVPEECTACHGQIAHAKAASRHARLPCTTCHEVPERHKTAPHSTRPTIPTNRGVCAACHAQANGSEPDAPQVDISTHYERYLCWQCHYPHNPRAL